MQLNLSSTNKPSGLNARISNAQRKLLHTGIAQMGLDVSNHALRKIELHLELIEKWRSKINLISVTNERELITHHALDSLVMAPFISKANNVLDLGTGAGFPGLQLASVFPEKKFTLLDSRQRRVEFLRLVATQAGFKNVELVTARIEDYPPLNKQAKVGEPIIFDTLIARAVASLSQLFSLTKRLHYQGQRLIAMKGQYPQAELDQLRQLHGDKIEEIQIEKLNIPFLEAERHAVIIQL